jgi:aspartyl-tRNA(Asn)/glutamyl-tRNA(Gln) amidotransferase subunit A
MRNKSLPTPFEAAEPLWTLSATRQAELVRQRVVSPVDLVDSILGRIAERDGDIHAFYRVSARDAHLAAVAAERDLAQGLEIGLLHGVPVSISDTLSTRGLETSFGAKCYAGYVPDIDDVSVERLRRAGAIIIGKTNVSELGFGAVAHNAIAPETRNPWNLDLTTTGGGGGSAAAVAAGMGAISIACDSGGSLRSPASMVGVVGFKPSFGRVPLYPTARDPSLPGVWSRETLEHVGTLSRTVADAALMMSVLSGPDPRDRHSIPSGDIDWLRALDLPLGSLRLAYTSDFGHAPVDHEIRTLTEQAARKFASQHGCELVVDAPDLIGLAGAYWGNVIRDSDISGLRDMAARGELYMPGLRDAAANTWSDVSLAAAARQRQDVVNRLWKFMSCYDLFLMPTTATTAFGLGRFGPMEVDGLPAPSNSASLPSLWPFNLTGQPAVTVPLGLSAKGLPIGLQIVGGHLADGLVLSAASAFESLIASGEH